MSYDILIIDMEELNAYISINLNKPMEKRMEDFVSGEDYLGEKLMKKFGDEIPFNQKVTKKYSGVKLDFFKSEKPDGTPHIFIYNSEDYFFKNGSN